MTKPSASYKPSFKQGDVVKVPFPFTDRHTQKNRPALVLSNRRFGDSSGHSVMAMITTARHSGWPLDVPISDLDKAGLPIACIVRMKLFTLDHRLIAGRLGTLAATDQTAVHRALSELLE